MLCKLIPGSSHLNNLCERFVKEATDADNKIVPFIVISSALALSLCAVVRWRWKAVIPTAATAGQSTTTPATTTNIDPATTVPPPAATRPESPISALPPAAVEETIDQAAKEAQKVVKEVLSAPIPPTSTPPPAPSAPPKSSESQAIKLPAVEKSSRLEPTDERIIEQAGTDTENAVADFLAFLDRGIEAPAALPKATAPTPAPITIAQPESTKLPAVETRRHAPTVEEIMKQAGASSEDQARELYKRAADLRDSNAMYQYAIMCREGKGGKVDVVEERKYLEQAYFSLRDDPIRSQVAIRLGEMWDKGIGGEKDSRRARDYYQAAASEIVEARFWIAQDLLLIPASSTEWYYKSRNMLAIAEVREMAAQGYIPARLKYLELNLNERCDDLFQALQFFDEAFNEFISPCYSLSEHAEQIMALLKQMKSLSMNMLILILARSYFKKLADRSTVVGKELAQKANYEYIQMIELGLGGEAEEANGIPHAMCELARISYGGLGCRENRPEARKWFKQAADSTQGWENRTLRGEAAYQYALMCHNGEGGLKDKEEAEKYIQLAERYGKRDAALPTRGLAGLLKKK